MNYQDTMLYAHKLGATIYENTDSSIISPSPNPNDSSVVISPNPSDSSTGNIGNPSVDDCEDKHEKIMSHLIIHNLSDLTN